VSEPAKLDQTLAPQAAMLGLAIGPMVYDRQKFREHSMKVFRIAAVFALLTGPAYAQQMPDINLIPELKSQTPEEKEQEAQQQKAYRDSLKKIPDAKASNDPWGTVRSTETPKTTAPAKPKTKTGSTQTKTETR
jgi:hypothetical protein